MFFRKFKVIYQDRVLLRSIHFPFSCSSGFHFVYIMLSLLICSDTESKPGLRRCDFCRSFLVCHWNLDSMTAHNFQKINLEAYNTTATNFYYIPIWNETTYFRTSSHFITVF